MVDGAERILSVPPDTAMVPAREFMSAASLISGRAEIERSKENVMISFLMIPIVFHLTKQYCICLWMIPQLPSFENSPDPVSTGKGYRKLLISFSEKSKIRG